MSLFTIEDVAAFRSDRVGGVASNYFPDTTLSDDYLLGKLQAAEAEASRLLKVFFEPTTVWPFSPTDDDLATLPDGMPWAEEPGYDYDPEFFQGESWGYLVLRQRPLISVEYVRMAYPNPREAFYTLPADWLRPDKKYGVLRFVPASAAFNAPLNAFLMQAMSGGSTIPSMIQVKYVAGLTNVRTDPKWADLLDVIYQMALLKLVDDQFTPGSGSISADGLSQSVSYDAEKQRDVIDRKLFGPKGVNGGLWTSIHGLPMSVAGMIA